MTEEERKALWDLRRAVFGFSGNNGLLADVRAIRDAIERREREEAAAEAGSPPQPTYRDRHCTYRRVGAIHRRLHCLSGGAVMLYSWRSSAVLDTFLIVVALVGGALLWKDVRGLAENNRELIMRNSELVEHQRASDCDLARLVSIAPVTSSAPAPGETPAQTRHRVRFAAEYVEGIRTEIDCKGIGRTAPAQRRQRRSQGVSEGQGASIGGDALQAGTPPGQPSSPPQGGQSQSPPQGDPPDNGNPPGNPPSPPPDGPSGVGDAVDGLLDDLCSVTEQLLGLCL
jgi:hypothetical protein